MEFVQEIAKAWWLPYLFMAALVGLGAKLQQRRNENATKKDVADGLAAMRTEYDNRIAAISDERKEIWRVIRAMDDKLDKMVSAVARIEGFISRNGFSK